MNPAPSEVSPKHPPSAPPAPQLSLLAMTAPVAMGYIPLGMVFGFLFAQSGGAWWLAALASLIIYAGAAQYMMVPLLAASTPLGALALATLIVNLRHIFYGLSLLDRFPRRPWPLRWYMVFALTDETYSVLTTATTATQGQMAWLAALNHCWWILGSSLGALAGVHAKIDLAGLDFVLPALFAVLAVEQWRNRRNPLPPLTALAAYTIAVWLLPRHALAIAIVLCIVASLCWPEKSPWPARGRKKEGARSTERNTR